MRGAAVLLERPGEPLPDVGVAGKLESRRHHADDRERLRVERHCLADDRGVAVEPLPPEPVADRDHRIAGVERRGRHAGTQDRLHADDGKEVRAGFDRVDAHRIAAGFGEVQLRIPPRGRIVEHLRQAAIVHEIHGRQALVIQRLAVIGFPHHRQTIGCLIRQGPQHDAVEQREYGGRRADTEPEREHRGDGEARAAKQQTPAKPDVLEKLIHGVGLDGMIRAMVVQATADVEGSKNHEPAGR